MLDVLIDLLTLLAILAVFFWIIKVAVAYFEGPAIIVQIAGMVALLIFFVAILSILKGGGVGMRWFHRP